MPTPEAPKPTPIRIHPGNRKLFEFRGKPCVLLCATEHYGAVMNRPFRFEPYLADTAERGYTLTRLFTLYRELQFAANPYSTCKPESPDYIAPFQRVGPGTALDLQPQYDLGKWNPEFFDRLHRFLSLASDYGIIVEITLFSNVYGDAVWSLQPLHPRNNINGVEEFHWPEYMTRRHPRLFHWQCAYVRKIVAETNRYDNIFYEICNEPGGGPPDRPTTPLRAEVNEWQAAIAHVIRDTERDLPRHHLLAGQEAYSWDPFVQHSDHAFADFPIDIVNIHPSPGTGFGGATYDIGDFMSKQLKLRALRDFCLASYGAPKPLNLDEDNAATQYKDEDGWTIHRKRAWTTLLSGAHYDSIDFSITIYTETGTPASQRCLRAWYQHLAGFIRSMDLIRARPLRNGLRSRPAATLESVLAVSGEDYGIYLADERELNESGCGDAIRGEISLDLPDGDYRVACLSPTSGLYSPGVPLRGGRGCRVLVPHFRHDIVIRIRRAAGNAGETGET